MSSALAVADAHIEIRPQRGPQERFLRSAADICITGGSAGGGKTFALLMEPLRHVGNPGFGAVIFRRTYPQITNEGGLWDEAGRLYPLLGAVPRDLEYRFRSGAVISFRHMQHAKDATAWTGSQVPMFGFDQLEEFEEAQFWYLLSRNRSARAGIKPYVRASCNPVPDDDPVGGWLHKLLSWWIDPATGYAIQARAGVMRWFVRAAEELHWGATRGELVSRFPDSRPKSLTFIPAKLSDNPALERADPGYRAWLMALPLVERERLLAGNWKIRPTAGTVFDRAWFRSFLSAVPGDVRRWVLYVDKAGTEGGGKYTAAVLMGERAVQTAEVGKTAPRFLIASVVRGQWSALNREVFIKQQADAAKQMCGSNLAIFVEQEPGSGGKESSEATIRNLAGHTVHADRVTGDKVTRAGPFSAQAEAGNVDLMVGPWNEAFMAEAHRFDGSGVCDQIDAASGAFNKLHTGPRPVRVHRSGFM